MFLDFTIRALPVIQHQISARKVQPARAFLYDRLRRFYATLGLRLLLFRQGAMNAQGVL
jgi:hypothetical protein